MANSSSKSKEKSSPKKKKVQKGLSKFIKKLDIRKKAIPVLLAGTVLAGVGIGAYKIGKNNGQKESISYVDENTEGFDSIGLLGTGKVEEDNFVILDIGDHNTVETSFQNKRMKLCNDNNISLGVVISSDAENECDIYNDVDYAKGIIRDYKIDFPVYLNIDKIVNNKKLNNDEKSKIIHDFLNKCSKNGMYVGISGTDTNLCKLSKFFDTTPYDSYLIMDKEKISYDGVYNVYKKLDGKIVCKSDLSKTISSLGLNSSKKFLNDEYVAVHDMDDFENLVLKYGIGYDDLLEFNDLSKRDIKDGKLIRVPCLYSIPSYSSSNNSSNNRTVSGEYLKGCDISYCQADNNNWPVLKENFDYIILKCNQGLAEDDYFENNALSCNSYDIPIGVYTFNNYWKTNTAGLEQFKKQQKEQAEFAVSCLKGKKIDYPVYLDVEKQGFTIDNDLPLEYANAMLDIWYDTISSAGYIPGLYLNQSVASCIKSVVSDYELSDKFEIWLAGGAQYEAKSNGEYIRYEIDDIEVPDYFTNNLFGVSMCQPGLVVNAGSGNSGGFLDFDFCKVDYANRNSGKNSSDNDSKSKDDIKEFRRIHKMVPITCVGLASLGIIGFGISKNKKKKEEEKKAKTKSKKK